MMREIKLNEQEQRIYNLLCAKTKSKGLTWKRSGPGEYYAEFGGNYGYRVSVCSVVPWTVDVSLWQGDHYLMGFVAPEIDLYYSIVNTHQKATLHLEKALDLLDKL